MQILRLGQIFLAPMLRRWHHSATQDIPPVRPVSWAQTAESPGHGYTLLKAKIKGYKASIAMLGESTKLDRGTSEFDLQFLVSTAKSGVVSAVYGNKAPASQQLKYAPPVWRICFPRHHDIYDGVFKHLLAHLDIFDPQACDNLCEGWSE